MPEAGAAPTRPSLLWAQPPAPSGPRAPGRCRAVGGQAGLGRGSHEPKLVLLSGIYRLCAVPLLAAVVGGRCRCPCPNQPSLGDKDTQNSPEAHAESPPAGEGGMADPHTGLGEDVVVSVTDAAPVQTRCRRTGRATRRGRPGAGMSGTWTSPQHTPADGNDKGDEATFCCEGSQRLEV